MTRLKWLAVVSLMLIPAPAIFAGGLCVPSLLDQRLATITPDGSLVTFFPNCKIATEQVTEYKQVKETITKLVNGKEVPEAVTRQVPVAKEVQKCVVEWMVDGTNWSPAPGKSLAFETDGKPIDGDALRERLKQPTLVVLSLSGSMIPQNVVAMLRPGTIVLMPPKPEIGSALLPGMEADTRPTGRGSRGDSLFQLVAFQDPPAVKPQFQFPTVTSPPASAVAVAWRNPDQVTLIGRFENEFLAKGFYKVSEGAHKVLKETQVRHRFVNIQSIDYPASSVSARTVDGRRVTPEILQRYLQAERTVVVTSTQDEVDSFWLRNFRPNVVVMTVPEEPAAAMPVAMPATVAPAPAGAVTKRARRMATPEELEQLLAAAAQADDARVTQWLNEGLNINQPNADGETALMRAAANGHNGYVATLITDHNADPSLRNKAGKTAEQLARENGHDATADAIAKHQK